MSCEDVANELIRHVFLPSPRQLATFEYVSKISVLLDQFGALGPRCRRQSTPVFG
jgi:hypothetical protein